MCFRSRVLFWPSRKRLEFPICSRWLISAAAVWLFWKKYDQQYLIPILVRVWSRVLFGFDVFDKDCFEYSIFSTWLVATVVWAFQMPDNITNDRNTMYKVIILQQVNADHETELVLRSVLKPQAGRSVAEHQWVRFGLGLLIVLHTST